MSDTLDRLKALNSKLEAKLSERKSTGKSSVTGAGSLLDLEIPATKKKKAANAVESHSQRPKQKTAIVKEIVSEEIEKIRTFTKVLIIHLGVDEKREPVRARNLERLSELYLKLDIEKKAPDIRDLFIYKAMNISGIGLKEEDFGEVREGKYVQVIAITYEPDKNGKKKAKNISLGYFGKAEALDLIRKNQVIEFVLRWRYEKAFQNLEHYRLLLEKVRPKESLF